MKIAFIYIAEPYQCYHTATVASALAAMPGNQVTEYYSFPDTPLHLQRIRRSPDLPDLPLNPFPKSWRAMALTRSRRLHLGRTHALKDSVFELNTYDALFAS